MSAAELVACNFAAFFAAVHGDPPFPWQDRLLRQVAENGQWPAVLDLPTGSGKTAALDIAVFHLALEASRRAEQRRAAVRVAFVVDRRLIVDDAYERAQRIANGVCWSLLDDTDASLLEARLVMQEKTDLIGLLHRVRAEPVVARAALRLRAVAGDDEPPLLARRLRGGAPREDDWARTPVQPTILCSTVDQVGSRLLFRGYGVSDRMKPIHAGLLGSDCLILLDEAHLAEPFRQTLDAVGRLRGETNGAPWGVALLTATPWHRNQEKREEEPFDLGQEDRDHPILAKRLFALKPAGLIDIPGKQGMPVENRRIEEIAERTIATLRTLRETISEPAIGVVVNRVARARAVFERLEQALAEEASIILVIGPARSAGRDPRIDESLDAIRTGAGRNLAKPLIVVATQTIEAGVDIDLDGLVTEAAALDALRQRFGRLNRAGREIKPEAAILAHKDDVATKADDPVYGERTAKTWAALEAAATERVVDFGIEAFPRELLTDAARLVSPKPDAPVLMPAYADLWSQTSPIPNVDPDVGLFLHGPKRNPAGVQIVWRADLREADLAGGAQNRERILEILALMPPRAAEAVEVPLWTARAWLRREPIAAFSDAPEAAPDEPRSSGGRPAFRYAGTDSERSRRILPGDIRPGDLIVVPATYGGCDVWGWNPDSDKPVLDVAELAAWPYRRRRFAVRVTAELIHQWLTREADPISAEPVTDIEEIRERLRSVLVERVEGGDAKAAAVLDAVLGLDLPRCLRKRLTLLRDKAHRRRLSPPFFYRDEAGAPRGVAFVAPFGVEDGDEADDESAPPATESEEIGLAMGYPLLLTQHSEDVRKGARGFAVRAGLLADLASAVALAGYLHDEGKSDRRFQAYLAGGDLLGWDDGAVLAKSGRDRLPKDAWDRAGLPPNWRHEACSVRLVRNRPELDQTEHPALVLWLVGVHHGFGRPLFPHADREELTNRPGPQCLDFDFNGRDWAQMFEELKQRHGIWGLARLEAFVRLADHRASEAVERDAAAGES